jgi:hypothetical protein
MADDYERLAEKTELSLWRTTCDPGRSGDRRSWRSAQVATPMTGRCLCSWLTEARSLEMSRLKPCGSDTYAPAPNCAGGAQDVPR